MAIRTFNSVGGFSVGEIPDTIITSTGNITGYNGTFRGNVVISNATASWGVLTDKLYYSNGVPWTFVTAGGLDTQIQFNDGGSNLGGSSNFTFNKSTNLLTVNGTANIGNINTTGTITANANVTAPWFIGNVVGNISGNIIIPGTSTGVVINDGGNANSFAGFTYTKANNYVYIQGNLSAANVSASLVTGTLTTASQPNITSVGTLTSLTVSTNANVGNLQTGNLTVNDKVTTSLVPSNDNTYDLGSTSYYWKNVYVSGNIVFSGGAYLYNISNIVYTDGLYAANNISAGSITSRGTTNLQGDTVVSGNLTVGGTTTYINVNTLSINDPLISLGGGANNANATTYDGYDRGLFLRNYKSDLSAPVNEFIGWKTANGQFEFAANAFLTGGANVVTIQEYGNLKGNVFFGNLTGTVLTASQPQITSLGSLTTLSVTNWANVGGQANVNSLKASGLLYPTTDGTLNQVLSTNGSGTLSWQTINTDRISNGTSNVNISTSGGNVQMVVGGTVTANFAAGGLDITNTLNVAGNTTVGLLQIGNTSVQAVTRTTSSVAPRTLVSLDGTQFRVAEFFVKGEDNTGGKYSVATVSMVHDATSADYSVYGTVNLPSSASTGTLSVTYTNISGTQTANLVVVPSSSNPTTWTVQYRVM